MIDLQHKNLNVWKLSIKLTADIYRLTRELPKEERFGLISQIRRAAVSISSNIAEGAARSSPKERHRFYEIARSSLVEIDTQLEISCVLGFIPEKQNSNLEEKMNHLFAMLSNMIKTRIEDSYPSHVCRLPFAHFRIKYCIFIKNSRLICL
jgi:four helix bundle protein